MKKIYICFLVFILNIYCFCLNYEIDKTLKISPLLANEYFNYEYSVENHDLIIHKNNDNQIYATLEDISWGNWELSEDHRKILYWRTIYDYDNCIKLETCLLDGNIGIIKKLDIDNIGLTSSDFQYILYWDNNEKSTIKFFYYLLEKPDIKHELIWHTSYDEYLKTEENSIDIFRSLDPKYDFHVYLTFSSYIFGEAFINIRENKLKVIQDGKTGKTVENIIFTDFERAK